MPVNSFGQAVGEPVDGWSACEKPARRPLSGRWCRLEPLASNHAPALSSAFAAATDGGDWTYLPDEPPSDPAAFADLVATRAASADPLFFAVVPEGGEAAGTIALMRVDAANGVVEIGHVNYAPGLQRTAAGSEAVFLLLAYAFDRLGYRRVEWKCDALNARSRRSAERFGFTYEGTFRQAVVVKQRNRDTAWFAMLDREWPAVRARFAAWLEPTNFDSQSRQVRAIGDVG